MVGNKELEPLSLYIIKGEHIRRGPNIVMVASQTHQPWPSESLKFVVRQTILPFITGGLITETIEQIYFFTIRRGR